MVEGGSRRVEQRQVLALLLAISALVLPVSGGLGFGLDLSSPVNLYLLGAVDRSTLLAPVLLIGALVLTVTGTDADPASVARRATPAVTAVAAVVLAVAFFGAAREVTQPGFSETSSLLGSGRAALVADFVIEGVICVAVVVFLALRRSERTEVAVP